MTTDLVMRVSVRTTTTGHVFGSLKRRVQGERFRASSSRGQEARKIKVRLYHGTAAAAAMWYLCMVPSAITICPNI